MSIKKKLATAWMLLVISLVLGFLVGAIGIMIYEAPRLAFVVLGVIAFFGLTGWAGHTLVSGE
jgi:hypothetical protein